jgi:segregation and condensation protein B
MPPSNLRSALEALLFSSDEPLTLALLAESLDAPATEVAEALQGLDAEYQSREAGVQLREIAGGHLLVTSPEHAEWVGRLLRGRKRARLSRAALETMAIIAYKQPVTKSEIEAIRGVDTSAVLATLMERNLITIRGRSKVVGRPLLYGTTGEFLDYFGLRDLGELPRPEELRALVAAREPEQLDMIELHVSSDVATDMPGGTDLPEAAEPPEMGEEAGEEEEEPAPSPETAQERS